MVKFAHYRLTNGTDELGKPVWQARGGVTIAFAEVEGGGIDWAASVCAPEDNFCKLIGRGKAQGRMNRKKTKPRYDFMRGHLADVAIGDEDKKEAVISLQLDAIATAVFQRMMELRLNVCGMLGYAIPRFDLVRKFGSLKPEETKA